MAKAVKKRVVKKRSAKRLSVRQILNVIDRYLALGGPEAGKLWDVISATRGPDNESGALKHNMTIPIRVAAFPRTAIRQPVSVGASFGGASKFSDVSNSGDSHFRRHAREAAHALDILV